MRRVERLGAELAYALRERDSRRALYEQADVRVREIERQILEASSNALEADTAGQPRVPDDRPTEQFRALDLREVPCPGEDGSCWYAGSEHTHDDLGRVWRQTS